MSSSIDVGSTLPARIAEDMIRLMKSHEINNGERLREEFFVNKYNVSQTVIREAFFILESRDFVNRIPRRGVYLDLPKKEEMPKIMKVREINEIFVNREFALNHTEEQIAIVESHVSSAQKMIESNEYSSYLQYGKLLHSVVYDFAGYPKLKRMYENIQDVIDIYYANESGPDSVMHDEHAEMDDHWKIFFALKAGDADGVEDAIRIHIGHILERLGCNV